MYHPYMRGKQYELLTVRETAPVLAAGKFTPIIEPVKEALSGLERALKAVCDSKGQAIVIVNPHHGEHVGDGKGISDLLKTSFACPEIAAGVLLKKTMTVGEIVDCWKKHDAHDMTFVHAGFTDAKNLVSALGDAATAKIKHIFQEVSCGKLYRKHFENAQRVLLRDGFVRRRNRDYEPVEFFSDLHVTFPDEGMDGFGDYLIVGDEFSESGGPAYAVAIHLSFIDPTKDDAMYMYHFVSKSQDTPTDPAGKFAEALDLLMAKLKTSNHHIYPSSAISEFKELHKEGHFPGLGYVKKLSMKHHIETLRAFLE